MDKQIREFLEYIELERGHSQLTIRNYESYLTKFAEFAESSGVNNVSKIDLELIKKWRLELHRRGLGVKTLNYYMIALRSFLKYLSKMDVDSLVPEKIELADTPDREIKFLEEEEVKRLLEVNSGKDDKEIRDRAMLEILFSTGIRVSELVALKRDQINLERGEFSVLGKGGKARVVFLSDSAAEWLDRYFKTRFDEDEAAFVKIKNVKLVGPPKAEGWRGQTKNEGEKPDTEQTKGEMTAKRARLTARQVQRIVQDSAKKAGIVKQVTPHVLRHSFATDILRAGADLRSVQSLLGHSSVTTTQVYTHVTDKHLREIHKKYHHREPESNKENITSNNISKK
ncbi:MAG: tyrosine-type recombinase/integrase [Candidatus Berkelbacteria bacterium]|nr:tyrosine-type recombinase/integrase [Candidatus Berkelbacteria bacterium]